MYSEWGEGQVIKRAFGNADGQLLITMTMMMVINATLVTNVGTRTVNHSIYETQVYENMEARLRPFI